MNQGKTINEKKKELKFNLRIVFHEKLRCPSLLVVITL